MNLVPILTLGALAALGFSSLAADPVPPLKVPEEQVAWAAIAARFTEAPSIKGDNSKTTEIAVNGLRANPKGGGTASVTIDKSSGRVVEVTSNEARFHDEEFAHFAAFPDLRALTLWHNSEFTGTGLAKLKASPKLQRITLAGGSFDDAGMAEAAKFPALRELRVWHAKFSDAGIAALRGHPTLESIKAGASWAPLLTNKTLEHLAQCPKLTKLGLAETWLTWKDGLEHLPKGKARLVELDLGNCIIDPAEVDRLRAEMPNTKISWGGPSAAAAELKKTWLRTRAESWIPKELIAKALSTP